MWHEYKKQTKRIPILHVSCFITFQGPNFCPKFSKQGADNLEISDKMDRKSNRATYYLKWAQIPPKHSVSKPTIKTIAINIPSRLDFRNIFGLLIFILSGLLVCDGANRYGEERCPKSPVLERAAT